MAGHSKWANIKRHKAKVDAKKGKLYTKIIREVTVAAKLGGGDPNANPRLRAALDKAQEVNMTKDVIERAIKRGLGGMADDDVEEIRYEGYGPGGVAILVDCMTNNRNRTVGEVRHAFVKHGGNLGTENSVAYLFTKQGQLSFGADLNEERIMEQALELDVVDVIVNDDNSTDVITTPENFLAIKAAFIQAKLQPENAEVIMRAAINVPISEPENVDKFMTLIEVLEDLDDVQEVYSNADIADELLPQ